MSGGTSNARVPRILVFTEGVLSVAHGTGTIFARNFAAYPTGALANWYIGAGHDPLLQLTRDLNAARWKTRLSAQPERLVASFWNRAGRKPLWAAPVNTAALAAATREDPFRPELVYGIVVSRDGLDSLRGVITGLPRGIPLVLHFHDFSPGGIRGFWRALQRLRPYVTEVWGVSPPILDAVAPYLPGIPTRFDPNFYLELPPVAKTGFRPWTRESRAVIMGNVWNPELLHDVRNIWRELRGGIPDLAPIQWHCHPIGVERARAAGINLGTEIAPAPFLRGNELSETMRNYDLAVLPFGRNEVADTDYERYSMPSRTTELTAAGLPIVCLSGTTPIAQYLSKNGIALCVPATQTRLAAAVIADLIHSPTKRQQLGDAARRHAETHFQLVPFQNRLAETFRRLANTAPAARS